jgi:hypothetical protein
MVVKRKSAKQLREQAPREMLAPPAKLPDDAEIARVLDDAARAWRPAKDSGGAPPWLVQMVVNEGRLGTPEAAVALAIVGSLANLNLGRRGVAVLLVAASDLWKSGRLSEELAGPAWKRLFEDPAMRLALQGSFIETGNDLSPKPQGSIEHLSKIKEGKRRGKRN